MNNFIELGRDVLIALWCWDAIKPHDKNSSCYIIYILQYGDFEHNRRLKTIISVWQHVLLSTIFEKFMFFRHLKFHFLHKQKRHLSGFVFFKALDGKKNSMSKCCSYNWVMALGFLHECTCSIWTISNKMMAATFVRAKELLK